MGLARSPPRTEAVGGCGAGRLSRCTSTVAYGPGELLMPLFPGPRVNVKSTLALAVQNITTSAQPSARLCLFILFRVPRGGCGLSQTGAPALLVVEHPVTPGGEKSCCRAG